MEHTKTATAPRGAPPLRRSGLFAARKHSLGTDTPRRADTVQKNLHGRPGPVVHSEPGTGVS